MGYAAADLADMAVPAVDRRLWLTGYLGFVLIGAETVLVPALIRPIGRQFDQSTAAFGLYFFLAALLYSSGSLGGGFLTERVGRRVVLPVAAGVIGIGLTGEAWATGWITFVGAALLANIGAGAIDGGTNGLFLDLFRSARGGALNLLHLFFAVGALICPFAVGQALRLGVQWRSIVLAQVAPAVVCAILLLVLPMPSGRHGDADVDQPARGYAPAEASLLPFAALAFAIGLYVASEGAITSWLVRWLAAQPVATATAVLSGFWTGLALGRLLSNWIAERFEYVRFTTCCLLASAVAVVLAVLVPSFPVSAGFFALAGLFQGPVFPMIVAIGGSIYPRRLAALGGSLSASGVAGSVLYPPLMGLAAPVLGLGVGLVGAGLLCVPAAASVFYAGRAATKTLRL